MTAPLNARCIRISFSTEQELTAKLIAVLTKRGYTVTKADAPRLTVGALAKLTGRNITNLSTLLHRADCPAFERNPRNHDRKRDRIRWLVPNDRLLAWLRK